MRERESESFESKDESYESERARVVGARRTRVVRAREVRVERERELRELREQGRELWSIS